MTKCSYQMIPAKADFVVWECQLEQNHEGEHWTPTETLEQRARIRDAYFIGSDKRGRSKKK